jgi:hypothetical protein
LKARIPVVIWYFNRTEPIAADRRRRKPMRQSRADLHQRHLGMRRGKADDVPRRRSRMAEDDIRIDVQPVDRAGACRRARPWTQTPAAATGSPLTVNDVTQPAPPSTAHDTGPNRHGMSTFISFQLDERVQATGDDRAPSPNSPRGRRNVQLNPASDTKGPNAISL